MKMVRVITQENVYWHHMAFSFTESPMVKNQGNIFKIMKGHQKAERLRLKQRLDYQVKMPEQHLLSASAPQAHDDEQSNHFFF